MKPRLQADLDGCRRAHRRLTATLNTVTDEMVARPSRLPDWTVGHVLAHLARNADSHIRRISGARRDEVVDQYPGGYEGRAAEIEAGRGRSARELVNDVTATAAALEAAWDTLDDVTWARYSRAVSGALLPIERLPFSRWREVEVHHADLGLGFTYRDWSEEFVAGELPRALAGLPPRLADPAARRRLCAWLLDRTSDPGPLTLEPWE